MGKIIYNPLLVTDFRDAAQVNSIFDAIEVQTTNIDGANLREEGLDERSLVSGISHQVFRFDDEGVVLDSNTTFENKDLGGGIPSLGPINLNGETATVLVRGMAYFESIGVSPGINPGNVVEIAIEAKLTGSPTVIVEHTRMRKGELPPTSTTLGYDGTLSTFAYFNALNWDFFRLAIRNNLGGVIPYRLRRQNLTAIIYRRTQQPVP